MEKSLTYITTSNLHKYYYIIKKNNIKQSIIEKSHFNAFKEIMLSEINVTETIIIIIITITTCHFIAVAVGLVVIVVMPLEL